MAAAAEDMMGQWRRMADTLRTIAPGSPEDELVRLMMQPLHDQAEMFEKVLQSQLEQHKKARDQLFAPLSEMLVRLEKTARSLRATGRAMAESGELMEEQASSIEDVVRFSREFRDAVVSQPAFPDDRPKE